jgi:CHAD domain-containing protein
VELASTVRADVGARQIHLALLGILAANESGLRSNLDTEFLHDFRTAIRRTRSLLGQIRQVFLPDVVVHFSTEFSWIGRLTGPPRDLDVLVLALRAHEGDFSAGDIEALLVFLSQAQQREHNRLIRALNSERYRRLLSTWEAFLKQTTPVESGAPNSGCLLAEVVSLRAWRLSRRIARSVETIDERTTAAQLHNVRIDTKKLRYLVDVTPTFYDAVDLECVVGALKKLQRVLGDFNDACVQEKMLLQCRRAVPAARGSSGTVRALTQLARLSRQRQELVRGHVVEKLARFRARDIQSACRRAFKRTDWAERAR